jgi:hypothetical protein
MAKKFFSPPRELPFAPLDFTLTGESAPDPERIARERKAAQEAEARASEAQTDLFAG